MEVPSGPGRFLDCLQPKPDDLHECGQGTGSTIAFRTGLTQSVILSVHIRRKILNGYNRKMPQTVQHSTANRENELLFFGFLLILFVSPWPLGSNRDWAWPVITFAYCGMSLVLLFQQPRPVRRAGNVILAALGVLCVWMLFQLVGIPGIAAPLTLDFYDTRADLLKTIGYIGFIYCALQLIRTRERVELVIYTVAICGLLQAVLGSVQVLALDYDSARGSFPNRNHFAGYLEMSMALGIGLMTARLRRHRSPEPFFQWLIDLTTGPQVRMRLMLMIMVVGLVLSRSRGGNLSFFTSLLLASGVLIYVNQRVTRNLALLIISILLIDAFLVGNYFGVERIAERVQQTTLETETRDELFIYGLTIAKDHPWRGTGAGTYAKALAQYRGDDISGRATNAENDYIEFLVELGAVGSLFLFIVLLTALVSHVQRIRDQSLYWRGIAFGCLIGTISLMLHSTVDFNLQIPANSLLFILILTLPMVTVFDHPASKPQT